MLKTALAAVALACVALAPHAEARNNVTFGFAFGYVPPPVYYYPPQTIIVVPLRQQRSDCAQYTERNGYFYGPPAGCPGSYQRGVQYPSDGSWGYRR